MELRTAASPKDVKYYDTKRLREDRRTVPASSIGLKEKVP